MMQTEVVFYQSCVDASSHLPFRLNLGFKSKFLFPFAVMVMKITRISLNRNPEGGSLVQIEYEIVFAD